MNYLSTNIKESINDFCEKAYKIIKTDHPKIR